MIIQIFYHQNLILTKIIKIYKAEESKNFISHNIKSIFQSNRFKEFSVY